MTVFVLRTRATYVITRSGELGVYEDVTLHSSKVAAIREINYKLAKSFPDKKKDFDRCVDTFNEEDWDDVESTGGSRSFGMPLDSKEMSFNESDTYTGQFVNATISINHYLTMKCAVETVRF